MRKKFVLLEKLSHMPFFYVQMLVYEFMPNGTLREWISGKEL
jgi:hypothetical protein